MPAAQRPRFQPIASGRSLEALLKQIREAIERGHLTPGEKLPAEPDLAAEFGVSRSVLREALKVLELSGYLDVRRGYGGGTFVSVPKPEEFAVVSPPPVPTLSMSLPQLAEVRLAIEPAAAGLAASCGLEAAVGLQEAIKEMETFDHRPARVLAAAVDFHVAVARASGNPIFVAVIESLRPLTYRAMNISVQSQAWRETCRNEHERIAKEIEGGYPERAERAMRDHLLGEGRTEPP